MLVQRIIFGYFAIYSVMADITRQMPTGAENSDTQKVEGAAPRKRFPLTVRGPTSQKYIGHATEGHAFRRSGNLGGVEHIEPVLAGLHVHCALDT